MRIALVTHSFDAFEYGGVPTIVKNIAKSAGQESNIELDIFSFEGSRHSPYSFSFSRPKSILATRFFKDIDFLEFSLYRVGSFNSDFEIFRYRQRKNLKNRLETYDCVLIVTGFLQFANVVPRLNVPIFVQCATRLIWERHSQYLRMSFLKRNVLKLQIPFLQYLEKKVLQEKKIFLVENSKMWNWISSESEASVIRWYPGVNDNFVATTFQDTPKSNGCFISIGRLAEARKGWGRMLEAYSIAYDATKDLPKLVIVGSGDFSESDQSLLEKYAQYPIEIYRGISDYERDSLLLSASIFLQSSYEEGLGLAAIEAMSFGLPLICSETDGSREYVRSGMNGLLIEQDSKFITNFAQGIIESQTWDYDRFSRNSKDIFENNFSLESSFDSLLAILYSEAE